MKKMATISRMKTTQEVVNEVAEKYPALHNEIKNLLGVKYDTDPAELSLLVSYFRIQSSRFKPNGK
jgi:hypothetical protein